MCHLEAVLEYLGSGHQSLAGGFGADERLDALHEEGAGQGGGGEEEEPGSGHDTTGRDGGLASNELREKWLLREAIKRKNINM